MKVNIIYINLKKLLYQNFSVIDFEINFRLSRQPRLSVCLHPIYPDVQGLFIIYIFLPHVIYHCTNSLHIDVYPTKCRFQTHVYDHLNTLLRIDDRLSKCKYHDHACYCLSIHLHIFFHQAKRTILHHLFYFHAIIHHTCCHRSICKDHVHVSYLHNSHLHIYFHHSRILPHFHLVNHFSSIPHILLRSHEHIYRSHWLYHPPIIRHKHLHQHARISLFR